MFYTYEGSIERVEGDWVVHVGAFPGCFGCGKTIRKACAEAAEALRLFIAEYIDSGRKLPRASFSNPPGCVIAVEVDKSFIRESACMTISQAAHALGITRGRASQLAKSGLLDSVEVDGRRMVTIASVNERKANPPAPHRPRGQ